MRSVVHYVDCPSQRIFGFSSHPCVSSPNERHQSCMANPETCSGVDALAVVRVHADRRARATDAWDDGEGPEPAGEGSVGDEDPTRISRPRVKVGTRHRSLRRRVAFGSVWWKVSVLFSVRDEANAHAHKGEDGLGLLQSCDPCWERRSGQPSRTQPLSFQTNCQACTTSRSTSTFR